MKKIVKKCAERMWLLARWLVLAGVTGVVLGVLGGLFGRSITMVTAFRGTHPWMLYLLPAAGLLIVAMYRMDPYKTGTNRVLEGIQSDVRSARPQGVRARRSSWAGASEEHSEDG